MAKNSKKRKNAPEKVSSITKKLKQDVPDTVAKPINHGVTISDVVARAGMVGGLIYENELETTTETLITLAQNPALIGLKVLKPFKTAVHDYWRVAHETTNTGSSLTSRISSALIDNRHIDALVLLSEMAIREQLPKLGALQRWVRECDAVLTPSMSQEEENRVWQVLDAILRTTHPEMIASSPSSHPGEGKMKKPGSKLLWFEPFGVDPGPPNSTTKEDIAPATSQEALEASLNVLRPLQATPGHERRPPNKHPMTIYFSPPTETSPFLLLPTSQRTRQPTRHEVLGVPGAFIINDALEKSECDALVRAAEHIGMTPDEPTAGSATQLASVLAHNFVWLADREFIDGLYARVVDLLPKEVNGGKATHRRRLAGVSTFHILSVSSYLFLRVRFRSYPLLSPHLPHLPQFLHHRLPKLVITILLHSDSR
ncbi:hypothetical protein NLJ89_g12044 [Agrocybe chaxingu]|uniref:Uncharacterized protein n=1 Tax=Agrocybe chaxingu TaxID=84603 RepID=A0A9W8JNV6_9AGAR|nr:hypothetical protein NLJ89_g12044 [Agrocybe chaxingu]